MARGRPYARAGVSPAPWCNLRTRPGFITAAVVWAVCTLAPLDRGRADDPAPVPPAETLEEVVPPAPEPILVPAEPRALTLSDLCFPYIGTWHDWWFTRGDMVPHFGYPVPTEGTYYFRPYHVDAVSRHQFAVRHWEGDREHPYDTRFLDEVYQQWREETGEEEPEPEEAPERNDLPSSDRTRPARLNFDPAHFRSPRRVAPAAHRSLPKATWARYID